MMPPCQLAAGGNNTGDTSKGDWVPGDQDSLNQLSNEHMSSQRPKQHAQGLHGSVAGPLSIYYSYYQFSIFVGLLIMRTSRSLTLLPVLETLSLLMGCWVYSV